MHRSAAALIIVLEIKQKSVKSISYTISRFDNPTRFDESGNNAMIKINQTLHLKKILKI